MRWIFCYGRRRNCAELLRGSLLGRALGRGLFGSRSGGSSVFLCSSRSLLGSSGLLRSGGLLGSRGFFRGRGLGGRNSFSVSRLRGCGRLLGRSLLRRSGGSLLSGSRLLCGALTAATLRAPSSTSFLTCSTVAFTALAFALATSVFASRLPSLPQRTQPRLRHTRGRA